MIYIVDNGMDCGEHALVFIQSNIEDTTAVIKFIETVDVTWSYAKFKVIGFARDITWCLSNDLENIEAQIMHLEDGVSMKYVEVHSGYISTRVSKPR